MNPVEGGPPRGTEEDVAPPALPLVPVCSVCVPACSVPDRPACSLVFTASKGNKQVIVIVPAAAAETDETQIGGGEDPPPPPPFFFAAACWS